MKNFAPGPRWLPAIIVGQTGPVSYVVSLVSNGRQIRRHLDHIRSRNCTSLDEMTGTKEETSSFEPPTIDNGSDHDNSDNSNSQSSNLPDSSTVSNQSREDSTESEIAPEVRRSTRVSIKPERFGENIYDQSMS